MARKRRALSSAKREVRAPVTVPSQGIPSREPSTVLVPSTMRGANGGPGLVDEMLRGHVRCAAGARDLRLGLASIAPVFAPVPNEKPHERDFRLDAQALLVDEVVVDVEQRLSGWADMAAHVSNAWLYGNYTAAARFVEDGAEGRRIAAFDRRRVELYPIHPSSIGWYETTYDGRLVGLQQQTTMAHVRIPVEQLVRVQHDGAVGEFDGVSILRPIAFLFERWKSIVLSSERSSYLAAGVAIVKAPPGEDAETRDEVIATWEDFENGESPFLLLPDGYEATFGFPAAGAADVTEQLEYIDAQFDMLFAQTLSSLGFSAHGSRALGEEAGASDDWRSGVMLLDLLRGYGRAAAGWLADQIGYMGRIPDLTTPEAVEQSTEPSVAVKSYVEAVQAGVITPRSGDEAWLRGMLGAPMLVDGATLYAERYHPQQRVFGLKLLASGADYTHVCTGERCSCDGHPTDSVEYASAADVEVYGADGKPYSTWRDLTDIESTVSWAENADIERALTLQLESRLDEVAKLHRAEVWGVIEDGYRVSDMNAMYAKYRPIYQGHLETYRERMTANVAGWVAREAERAQTRGLVISTAGRSLTRLPDPNILDTRMKVLARVRAEEIASRVQGEVESAFASGARSDGWTSRITAAGLARPAAQIAATVVAEGRVTAAREVARATGLIPVSAIRTSIPDGRCPVCRRKDGMEFDLQNDRDAWEANPLPDPECDGGAERCRCGWLLRWGRVIDREEDGA